MVVRIKYSYVTPGERRKHYLCQTDIEVLLGRLPEDVYERLRAVHFNDRAWGNRRLYNPQRGRSAAWHSPVSRHETGPETGCSRR